MSFFMLVLSLVHLYAEVFGVEIFFGLFKGGFHFVLAVFATLEDLDAGVFGTENGGEGGLIAGDEFDDSGFAIVRKVP